MSEKCTDRDLGKLLHLYELDLLEAKDRDIFEIHLLECSYCHEQLTDFQKVMNSLLNDPDTRQHVNDLVTGSQLGGIKKTETRQINRAGIISRIPRLRFLAIAAAILVILLLRPWRFEFGLDDDAYAGENRLAVMNFNQEGVKESALIGKMLTSLLSSDLSESRFIQVVPAERVSDIIQSLGHGNIKNADRNLAKQVAAHANAKWIVLGNVSSIDSGLTVTIQLLQIDNDSTFFVHQIHETSSAEVFKIVDELSKIVKNSLPLPKAALEEPDPQIADITTHSTEAYRYYIEGLEAASRMYYAEAIEAFEKALTKDSTFAMAYYHLSMLKNPGLIKKAAEFSKNATHKERRYIDAQMALLQGDNLAYENSLRLITERYPDEKEAFFSLCAYYRSQNDHTRVISYARKTLAIDPKFKLAYNELAYAWNELEEFDSSMAALDKYIELAPDEPNPYDSKGEIYALNGNLDKAIEAYQKALEIKPDFMGATFRLGNLYVFKGEYDKAASWYHRANSFRGTSGRTIEMFDLAVILMQQGRFDEAGAFFDREISGMEMDSLYTIEPWVKPRVVFLKTLMLAESNPSEATVFLSKESERYSGIRPDERISPDAYLAALMARTGRYGEADSLVDAFQKAGTDVTSNLDYWFAAGMTEYYRGRYMAAVDLLSRITTILDHRRDLIAHYYLAEALLKAHHPEKAADLLRKQLNTFSRFRLLLPMLNVKLHYLMGIAYEDMGQYHQAAEQYRRFLNIWKSADKNITSIADARSRLARLKAHP